MYWSNNPTRKRSEGKRCLVKWRRAGSWFCDKSLCDIVEHYEYKETFWRVKARCGLFSSDCNNLPPHLENWAEWTDKSRCSYDWRQQRSRKIGKEEIIGTKSHKELKEVKDNNDPLKIAIMDWYVAHQFYDVPSLATMCKPMHGYNLIYCVLTVCSRIKGGLIVDYVGIASALKLQWRDTSAISLNTVIWALQRWHIRSFRKLQVCRFVLVRFQRICRWLRTMANSLRVGKLFILDASIPERKDLFLKEVCFRQSHSLCSIWQ